jgi:hypothetical protein
MKKLDPITVGDHTVAVTVHEHNAVRELRKQNR